MFDNTHKNTSDLLGKEIKVSEEHHFTWKVKNFAKVRESKEALRAQRLEFKMGDEINLPTEWFIRLDTFDEKYKHKKRLGVGVYIGLMKKPDDAKEVNICYQFKMKEKNGKGCVFDLKKGFWKNMATVSTSWGHGVIPSIVKNKFLCITEDGSLNFEIHVKLYAAKKATPGRAQQLQLFHAKYTKKQQSDMASMLLENWSCSNADSTTKVVCKDGVELAVHRGILSVRSPVFLEMFQANMKEANTGVVEVKDISSMPMKILLHFLYTGILQDNCSSTGIVEELVLAAGKYEQDDLVEFLDPMLVTVCTEENVGKLMHLARKLNMKEAEKDLFQFIVAYGITYKKLEGMVKGAIASDLNQPPVGVDNEASGGDNCHHENGDKDVKEPLEFSLLTL